MFSLIVNPAAAAYQLTCSLKKMFVIADRVPNAENICRMLNEAGFVDIAVTDEPEFYLAIGRKGQP
ncbi:MAG: hypothetical protein ABFD54_06590 [Armatimonadota bacterium]